jgi:hypothetical protein
MFVSYLQGPYTFGVWQKTMLKTPADETYGEPPEAIFFAANGKTSIQGITYQEFLSQGVSRNRQKIYKDKTIDYGAKLASVLGVTELDIIAVMLDIKKSDIDKLK